MSEAVGTLNLVITATLSAVASEVARQYEEDDVLSFLAEVDERVGSWDFTEKAAKLFASKAMEQYEQAENPNLAALKTLREFVRQLRALGHYASNPNFYTTVWTDPHAHPVHLSVDDLEALMNLATLGLEKQG